MPLSPVVAFPAPVPVSPNVLPPVCLPQFEGPLDLLLHLVRAGQMDIFDLPMAVLCDQYATYLRVWHARDLTVAGDFLVMAATLLEIKSRLLLPQPPKAETDAEESANGDALSDDPRALLVRQLLEYGKYQSMAEILRAHETARRDLFFRDQLSIAGAGGESHPFADAPPRFGEQSAQELWRTLQRLLATVGADERGMATVTAIRKQRLTLRLTMRLVLGQVRTAGFTGVCVEELLPTLPFALFEAVLLFLALLELIKTGDIVATQNGFCGELRLVLAPDAEAQRAK